MNDTQQNQPQPYAGSQAPSQPVFYQQPQPVYQPVYVPAPAPAFAIRADAHPQRTQASKAINRAGLVTLMQTVISFLFTTLIIMLTWAIGVNIYSDSLAFQLFNAASVPVCTALPFFLYMKLSKSGASEYLKFERVGFGVGLLIVLGGLGISLLANYPASLIQNFFSNFGYEPGDSASIAPDVTSLPLLVTEFLTTAVLVPVMEEFAFRGVLLSSLKRFGPGLSITVSAFIFALAHLDLSGVIFAFIAGLVFGAIYYYTENLWLSIFIHALNNGLAVLCNDLPSLFSADEFLLELCLVTIPMVIGLVAVVILAVLLFRKRLSLPGQGRQAAVPVSAGESFVALVRSPTVWVLFLMMAAYTVSRFFR